MYSSLTHQGFCTLVLFMYPAAEVLPSHGFICIKIGIHNSSLILCLFSGCSWNKVCAEKTRKTADSCFGLVGPHQRCVC